MKRHQRILIGCAVISISTLTVLAFNFADLLIIEKTRKTFLLDEQIGNVSGDRNGTAIDFQPVNPNPEYKQPYPSYMKKYGMNFGDYYDNAGNFSPKGLDWKQWGTAGRTVAVLNWSGTRMSAYRIHETMHCVSKYLEEYDEAKPVIPVIKGCTPAS